MDLDGLYRICDYFGLAHRRPTSKDGFDRMVIECPLAPWKHNNPEGEARNPATQVTLNPFGQSKVYCFSTNCAYKGTLYYLIWRRVHSQPEVSEADTKLLAWINEAERDDVEAIAVRAYDAALGLAQRETLRTGHVSDFQAKSLSMPIGMFKHEDEVLDEIYLDQFHNGIPVYVTERGIKVETAKQWGLRYDKRLQRVVFPSRRMDGKLVGVSGRILPAYDVPNRFGDHPLRYYNYCGLNKMRYLYGAHLFKRHLPVVLVEGQFDALKTSQALGDKANVGSTLGHGFSDDHRRTIASTMPDAIYLFQDDDTAGRSAAEMIASKLVGVAPLLLMRPTGGKDPGAMTDEAIRQAFETARPLLGDHIEW